jgi:hypothetical protein
MMKLVNSIVILERDELGSQVIDLVLLVKHPDGCDPVERIRAGIGDFIKTHQSEIEQPQGYPLTWSDLFHKMQDWDWSTQGLFIEAAPMWMVIAGDNNLLREALYIT